MREIDLGISETGHDPNLTPVEARCLDKLQTMGCGRKAAIPAYSLARYLNLGCGDPSRTMDDFDEGKRFLRKLINHLIITHGLPIICQAGSGGGYYLAGDSIDVDRFYHSFHHRAMTGLVKASRGRKSAFVDIMAQLSLGFDDPDQKAAIEKLRLSPEEDPVPAWVQLITKFLDRLSHEPEKYAAEIRNLQAAYGEIFVNRQTVLELKRKTAEFQELLQKIA